MSKITRNIECSWIQRKNTEFLECAKWSEWNILFSWGGVLKYKWSRNSFWIFGFENLGLPILWACVLFCSCISIGASWVSKSRENRDLNMLHKYFYSSSNITIQYIVLYTDTHSIYNLQFLSIFTKLLLLKKNLILNRLLIGMLVSWFVPGVGG